MGKIKSIRKHKPMTMNDADKQFVRDMVANSVISRTDLLNKLIDPRRDINDECGYPDTISTSQYKLMYDREGIATRIVSLYPEESWAQDPVISENDEAIPTEFEKEWNKLEQERNMYSYMMRADELSGIGRFGVLLLGIDDGKKLDQPVAGISDTGGKTGSEKRELLYCRPLDESCVKIKKTETDINNPRYGKPVSYQITLETQKQVDIAGDSTSTKTGKDTVVHWTRVIHLADNKKNSEIYGVPRMQVLFNRLYDIRKITGGSAEMFWKGGFPGYSFEMDENAQAPAAGSDEDIALTEQITAYANGLQRYLRLQGIKVNSLTPQMADPKAHFDAQLEYIAIALGVPKRIFMGSEQAKLASETDAQNWNKRMKRRQNKYITPYIIRPTIDRLIAMGVLPEVEEYFVAWPDLDTPSDKDRAEVMKMEVEAFAKYVQGNVDMLVPPDLFFKMYAKLDASEIKEIMDKLEERQEEFEEEQEELERAATEAGAETEETEETVT